MEAFGYLQVEPSMRRFVLALVALAVAGTAVPGCSSSATQSVDSGTVSKSARDSRALAREPHLVPGELAVRVLDDQGVGMTDVEVMLHAYDSWILDGTDAAGLPNSYLPRKARTATDGACSFHDLPPGVPFRLFVTHKGRLVRTERERVLLAPGESRSIELHLGAGTTITGRLLDQDGEPVADYPVWLLVAEDGSPRPFSQRDVPIARTSTDALGNFALDDVVPGAWWLGPGWKQDCEPYTFQRTDVAGQPEVVSLASGEEHREVIVRAHRGLAVEGRVVDPNGRSVRGAFVSTACMSTINDGTGAFAVGPLLPGAHDIEIFGVSPWASPEASRVEAGSTGVVIEILRAGTVRCVVLDASGGQVRASVLMSRERAYYDGTQAAGERLEIPGVLPGRYKLFASTADACAVAREVVVEAGSTTDVSLALSPAARLAVRFTSESPRAELEVWWDDVLVESLRVAARSSYVCTVPPGSLRVVMTSTAGTQERIVEAHAGEFAEVAFE